MADALSEKHSDQELSTGSGTSDSGSFEIRTLCEALENDELDIAEAFCKDRDYDINERHEGEGIEFVGYTPLMYCASYAHGKLHDDEMCSKDWLKLVELILEHPKCDVNLTSENNNCALNVACGENVFGTPYSCVALALLKQPEIDLTIQQEENSFTPLHTLFHHLNQTSYKQVLEILTEVMQHPQINECVKITDKYGRSALDLFLLDPRFHAYDIDEVEQGKPILHVLLTQPSILNASGHTMAIAGTFCSPAVFQKLLDSGGSVTDSLQDNETTAHTVIQRNSVSKSLSTLDRYPDMSVKFNNLTPSELAQSYSCKPEIMDKLATITGTKASANSSNVTSGDRKNKRRDNTTLIYAREKHVGFAKLMQIFKENKSSKIRIKIPERKTHPLKDTLPVFVVQNNQVLLQRGKSEINKIKECIDEILIYASTRFRNSQTHSYMEFDYFLSGSVGDNMKCYFPDEFDIVCVFKHTDNSDIVTQGTEVRPEEGSGWKEHCDSEGSLDIRQAAQAFYKQFAAICYDYNLSIQERSFGCVRCLFQVMDKICRLSITWKGKFFDNLTTSVDIVPAFKCTTFEPEDKVPLSLEHHTFYAIAKISRNEFIPRYDFPISFYVAESRIMKMLPNPIRQGLISAKAMRLSSIVSPAINLKPFHVVEDLNIEDYVTSHFLKTSLLNLLQRIKQPKDVEGEEAVLQAYLQRHRLTHVNIETYFAVKSGNKYCKYEWADRIYHELEDALEKKRTIIMWHSLSGSILNCENCDRDYVCCMKRKIRLALVKRIRLWLLENIRALHGGDMCSCVFSQSERDKYDLTLHHLKETGLLPF